MSEKERKTVNFMEKIDNRLKGKFTKLEESIIDGEVSFAIHVPVALMRLRKSLGITQKELAKRLGVRQSWISKLESARFDHRIDSIIKYLKGLGAELELRITVEDEHHKRELIISEDKIEFVDVPTPDSEYLYNLHKGQNYCLQDVGIEGVYVEFGEAEARKGYNYNA